MLPKLGEKAFEWKIEDVLEMGEDSSRGFRCGPTPMKLIATVEGINANKVLVLMLTYNGVNRDEKSWMCEVDWKVKIHAAGKRKNINSFTFKSNKSLCTENENHSFISYMLKDMEKHKMIIDGDVTLKFHCTTSYFNFATPQPTFSNVKIVVQGTPFHVSRDVLSLNCRSFPSEFISNNQDDREFCYDGLRPHNFCLTLLSFDPSFGGVTDGTLKKFLKLNKALDLPGVYLKCEKVLLETKSMNMVKKLKIAEKYGNSRLIDALIASLKSAKEVKNVHTDEMFNNLGVETRLRVLDVYKLYV